MTKTTLFTLLLSSAVASATPIGLNVVFGGNATSGAARTAYNNFVTAMGPGVTTETFTNPAFGVGSGLNQGIYTNNWVSAVGTFVMPSTVLPGTAPANNNRKKEFNLRNSERDGRFDTTPGVSGYLDSNDTTGLELIFAAALTPVRAVGFFMTDAGDAGANTTITLSNGKTLVVPAVQPNAGLRFVSYVADKGSNTTITKITWSTNRPNDGFGLDDFIVAQASPVPEPSSYAMMGGAMLALGWLARRRVRG